MIVLMSSLDLASFALASWGNRAICYHVNNNVTFKNQNLLGERGPRRNGNHAPRFPHVPGGSDITDGNNPRSRMALETFVICTDDITRSVL